MVSAEESREDRPLKASGSTSAFFWCDRDAFGGPKFINFAFAILTVIITAALLLQINNGDYQVAPHGSVASDDKECSSIGTTILKSGGNAVDAAIAGTFCLAVVNPQRTSLDSGSRMLIYSHTTRTSPILVEFEQNEINSNSLPRLVVGLAYAHVKFGKLSWKKLVEPSLTLARDGFYVSKQLLIAITKFNLTHVYGKVRESSKLSLKDLAKTLQKISNIPEKELKNSFLNEDLQAKVSSINFKDYNVYAPASVSLTLLHGLTLLQDISENQTSTPEYTYNLAKISENVRDDQVHPGVSSNIAVIDKHELYASLITGLRTPFGSGKITTGGFLLDVIADTLTERVPLVITNKHHTCGRRILTGANDAITALQIVPSLTLESNDIVAAVENPRFYINEDRSFGLEKSHPNLFNQKTVEYLETLKTVQDAKEPYDSCNVVEKVGDQLNSHSDSRGGGIASRF